MLLFVHMLQEAIALDHLNDCSVKIGGNLDAVAHRGRETRALPPPACRGRSNQTEVRVT